MARVALHDPQLAVSYIDESRLNAACGRRSC